MAEEIPSIIYCQKCGIANIAGVFYWSYKNQPTTPEKVLAKVCIPTTGKGDRTNLPCLAKLLYESDLGLAQKTSAELKDFVNANSNAVEFGLPNEEYYLKMAKEIIDEKY